MIAQQHVKQLVSTDRRQGIESQLGVGTLLPPTVLILAPVRDEQQQARAEQALDQAVQQRLGLGVDPVQVLDEQEYGALAGVPQQQPFHGVEGALAPLCRLKPLPRGVLPRHLQQGEQRRERRLERGVQGAHLARHLVANLVQLVPVLQREVALEKVDHRPVAHRLAVRDGGGLEHQPAVRARRVGDLVGEARLADPVVPDHRHHLPMSRPGALQRLMELLQLAIAADEAGEAAGGGRL